MYAVIKTGGKQYRVAEGQLLRVEKLPGAKGDKGDRGDKGDKGDRGNPGAAGPPGPGGAVTEDVPSFAGFTSASYNGKVAGGRTGMHALCAAAFTGGHLCHAAEYIQASSRVGRQARWPGLDVPSLSETPELKDLDVESWLGLLGPANLPPAVTSTLINAMQATVKDPEIVRKLGDIANRPVAITGAQFGEYLARERQLVQGVVTHITAVLTFDSWAAPALAAGMRSGRSAASGRRAK